MSEYLSRQIKSKENVTHFYIAWIRFILCLIQPSSTVCVGFMPLWVYFIDCMFSAITWLRG